MKSPNTLLCKSHCQGQKITSPGALLAVSTSPRALQVVKLNQLLTFSDTQGWVRARHVPSHSRSVLPPTGSSRALQVLGRNDASGHCHPVRSQGTSSWWWGWSLCLSHCLLKKSVSFLRTSAWEAQDPISLPLVPRSLGIFATS